MKGVGKYGGWQGKGFSYGGKGGEGQYKGINDMDLSNGTAYDMPWMETGSESQQWPNQTSYMSSMGQCDSAGWDSQWQQVGQPRQMSLLQSKRGKGMQIEEAVRMPATLETSVAEVRNGKAHDLSRWTYESTERSRARYPSSRLMMAAMPKPHRENRFSHRNLFDALASIDEDKDEIDAESIGGNKDNRGVFVDELGIESMGVDKVEKGIDV